PRRRRPLFRPAPARPPQRGLRGPVPRHPPPRARFRGAVPGHRGRRRGTPARGRPARAGAQRRRGDRRPQPPQRQCRAQRRRPRRHRAPEAGAGAGGHPPARPLRRRRRRPRLPRRARVGLSVVAYNRQPLNTANSPVNTPLRALVRDLVGQGIETLRADGTLPADLEVAEFVVERPKDRSHGDFSSNAAMLLARPAKSNPRALAQALVAALPPSDAIAAVEIAGPGFLNFRLSESAWQGQLRTILAQGADYGRNDSGQGRVAGVEYVSANPTGPLHVGHGRAAVIGDCIARVLDANGWRVRREYYYNDAGAQIDNLAKSVQARALGKTPDDPSWPEDGYRGDYIVEVAQAYLRGETVAFEDHAVTGAADPHDLDAIRRFAVAWLRREQNDDLEAYGVAFDVYFLESSLYADGKVEETVGELVANGHTYAEGGALWLRTTDFGDDKDRVLRKSDGTYTYFVPDVAYHLSKWQRGYERAITEVGADHHGSLARVRAG